MNRQDKVRALAYTLWRLYGNDDALENWVLAERILNGDRPQWIFTEAQHREPLGEFGTPQ
jgi:hypothetical protein